MTSPTKFGRRVDVEEMGCRARYEDRLQGATQAGIPSAETSDGRLGPDEDGMPGPALKARPCRVRTGRQAQTRRTGERHVGKEDQRLALDRS